MNAPPPNKKAGALCDQDAGHEIDPGKDHSPLSLPKVALTMSVHVPLPLAMQVAAEANRIDAEERDRNCRCPGRAYVVHAWDLRSHKDECRAGYAWLSVDEALAALEALPRQKLAALGLAVGGAA